MKYCKNCGMLLEDTQERCIKCGTDVTLNSNVSLYPPEVLKTMESEKETKKKRSGLIAILIVVFVVFLGLMGLIIWKLSTGDFTTAQREPKVEEVVEEEPQEEVEPEVTPEPEPVIHKEVKDDEGNYYALVPQFDAGGNQVFNAIYPEDVNQIAFNIDLERYSEKYPEVMSLVANDTENTVRFTYMSPQQFWHKQSEKGKSRTNERDPQYFMSFFSFKGADGYIDALVKQSYPNARKITAVGSYEISAPLTSAVEALSNTRKQFFLNSLSGDYAHIGEDVEYATMGSTCSAYMYEYEITDKDKETLYCKYYVPVISNDLYYASDLAADMGTITEWFVPCVCGFETGNDMLYDDYKTAFELFCANAVPTRAFFYSNYSYGAEIAQSIEAGIEPSLFDEAKLSTYAGSYSDSAEIGEFNENMMTFLKSYGIKTFSSDSMTIHAPANIVVAYYNKDDNKLFISPIEDEYPGDDYEELSLVSDNSSLLTEGAEVLENTETVEDAETPGEAGTRLPAGGVQ